MWEISGFRRGVVEAFSSGVLRRVGWRLATDVSGTPVGPIVKGQESMKTRLVTLPITPPNLYGAELQGN
jgi:hypothetical protein